MQISFETIAGSIRTALHYKLGSELGSTSVLDPHFALKILSFNNQLHDFLQMPNSMSWAFW
jgi:hypothetical protein